jgi:hypothetical protein
MVEPGACGAASLLFPVASGEGMCRGPERLYWKLHGQRDGPTWAVANERVSYSRCHN